MTLFVLDSWAWIEHLRGSERGEKVREVLADEKNDIVTSSVTIAEIVSKFSREGFPAEGAYTAVVTSSKVVDFDSADAKEAGVLHAAIKKMRSNFSLADAVVLHLARKEKGKVLTGDPDFQGIEEAVIIG